MAFSIFLEKIHNIEDNDSKYEYYLYRYFCADTKQDESGSLKIEKSNGDVYMLEYAHGDTGAQADRAARKLMKHWLKGEFPEKTYWAS